MRITACNFRISTMNCLLVLAAALASTARADDPETVKKLAGVSVNYSGRATEVRIEPRQGKVLDSGLACRASGVAAVRFEFYDGPLGFNVYREIQVIGAPKGK